MYQSGILDLLKDKNTPFDDVLSSIEKDYEGNINKVLKGSKIPKEGDKLTETIEGTIFWWSVYYQNDKIAEAMIDHYGDEIDINASSSDDYASGKVQKRCKAPMPLWLAITNQQKALVKKIIEKYNRLLDIDSINIVDTKGECGSILGLVIYKQEWELACLLLEYFPEADIYAPFMEHFWKVVLFPNNPGEKRPIFEILCKFKNEINADELSTINFLLRYNRKLNANIIQDILFYKEFLDRGEPVSIMNISDILQQLKENPCVKEGKLPVQNFDRFETEQGKFSFLIYPQMDIVSSIVDHCENLSVVLKALFYKAAQHGLALARTNIEKEQRQSIVSSNDVIVEHFNNAENYALKVIGYVEEANALLEQIRTERAQYLKKPLANSFTFLTRSSEIKKTPETTAGAQPESRD